MTTIRTVCPHCGQVDLAVEAVIVVPVLKSYKFQCPTCLEDVHKAMDTKIYNLLLTAGCAELDTLDMELPARNNNFPPLTIDDAIEFHFKLEDDDYVKRFLDG